MQVTAVLIFTFTVTETVS